MNEEEVHGAEGAQDEASSGSKKRAEFAEFLRAMGVRALDQLAMKIHNRDELDSKTPKPMRKIADQWLDMSGDQREQFVDQVISAAETIAAAAPAAIVALRAKKKKDQADADEAKPKKKSSKKSHKKKDGDHDDGKKKKKGKKK